MIFIGVFLMKPAHAEWYDLSPNPFEEIYQQSQQENITYTPSEETHCLNGKCTLTLYSGVRYVFEDNIWKPIENAKSLKNIWNKVYLEKDKDFDIDVLEVNYTDLVLNLSFYPSSNITELIAKYPECGASKTNDIKCDLKLTIKEDVLNNTSGETYKTETKFQYKYQEKNGVKESLKFTQKGNPLGKEYTFGGNSTTIKLQDNVTENLEDTYLSQYTPTTNYGSYTTLPSGEGSTEDYAFWTIIKFNISSIPASSTIEDSKLCWYISTNAYDTGETATSWIYQLNNQTWTEEIPTWNTKPNGIGSLIDTNNSIDGDWALFWLCFNATSWVNSEYNNYKTNVSFLWNSTLNYNISDRLVANSKENSLTSLSPYLNITYEAAGDSTAPTYSSNSTNSTLAGTPVKHNLYWQDNIGLSGYIFSFDNCTGTLTNNSFVAMTGTANWSNVTKTINSTVGCTIQWKVYANDTTNNWNTSLTYSYLTTSAGQQYNQTGSLSMTLASDKYRVYNGVKVKDLSMTLTEDSIKSAFMNRLNSISLTLTEDSLRMFDARRLMSLIIDLNETGFGEKLGEFYEYLISFLLDLIEDAKVYIQAWEEVSPYKLCSILQQIGDSRAYLCVYPDATWKVLIKGV